jgi:hypothetical protein
MAKKRAKKGKSTKLGQCSMACSSKKGYAGKAARNGCLRACMAPGGQSAQMMAFAKTRRA